MNQQKIGKFIAECRKKVNLTQMQLADKLGITDRAISKWENGKAMPDSSIMLELCDILKISVNDLLCGEVVTMDNYNREMEKNLIEMVKRKELSDKRLLQTESLIAAVCVVFMLTLTALASFVDIENWLRTVLIIVGVAPAIIVAPFMMKIEQTAGYYQCSKCGHKHIPAYKNVFFSMHFHTTRYLKCPKCRKYSWQKKVLNKD